MKMNATQPPLHFVYPQILPVLLARRRIAAYGDPSSNIGGCGHAAGEASFEKEANDQSRDAGAGSSRSNLFAGGKCVGFGRTDRRRPTQAELRARPGDRAQRRRTRRRQPRHLPSQPHRPWKRRGRCAARAGMRWLSWLRRCQRLRRLPRLRRMQSVQRLPLRRRLRWMWWLRRRLDRGRRAMGVMRRLLCIVGPLPLVLGSIVP